MEIRTLKGRDLLSIADLSRDELRALIELSKHLKSLRRAGIKRLELLSGKVLGLIFEKHSTRTRVSLEVAMRELGGESLYMSSSELQLARGEPIKDTARVLERYLDAIAARVYRHSTLVELAKYANIPVINALSDVEHPLQALADVMTIEEFKGDLRKVKVAFVGDGSDNVLHSLMLAIAKLGGKIYVATAKGYEPRQDVLKLAQEEANVTGAEIVVTYDPIEAVSNADVVYTDVWVSMGQESEREKRIRDLRHLQVNPELVKHAKKDYIFMHCLPAHRGEEVVEEVIESEHSVVWDQAENRLHTAKAVLIALLR